MRRTSTGFAVICLGLALLTLAFISGITAFAFTDAEPGFLSDELKDIYGAPSKAGPHIRNIAEWAEWRAGARAKPPAAYEFHKLIDLIKNTVVPETWGPEPDLKSIGSTFTIDCRPGNP